MDDFEKNITWQVVAMIDKKLPDKIIKVKEQLNFDLNFVTDKVNKMETVPTNVVKSLYRLHNL